MYQSVMKAMPCPFETERLGSKQVAERGCAPIIRAAGIPNMVCGCGGETIFHEWCVFDVD